MLSAHLNNKLKALLPEGTRFAIAFSGGGDSTALVHALKDHPQRGLVYIVDHALRAGSGAEAQAAKHFAQSCGYETKILTWKNNSPQTGLQEKARRARYGLMGEECRNLGLEHLLTAHSKDDQAETLLMRYDKQTDWRGAAGISEISYAPVWPELAQVNICRPLLGVTRQDLREYNRSHNLLWSEDPSNENRDYSRIRARDHLKTHLTLKSDLIETAEALSLGVAWERENLRAELAAAKFGPAGDITFQHIPSIEMLGLALRCVGGSGAVIPRHRLALLHKTLMTDEVRAITLLGAQAVRDKEGLVLSRDLVAVRGRKDKGLKPRAISMLISANLQIWDGRVSVSSKMQGYNIQANYGLTQTRSKALQLMLSKLHKSARPTCPVIVRGETAYAADEIEGVEVKSLIKPRLEATLLTKPC